MILGRGGVAGNGGGIGKVFPDRKWVDLPLDHPLYHCVFDIKSKAQIPGIGVWERSHVTWERYDAHETHHRVIFDDKGRIMVFATHNTDNGDGWSAKARTVITSRIFPRRSLIRSASTSSFTS